jgi:hypothetical protein
MKKKLAIRNKTLSCFYEKVWLFVRLKKSLYSIKRLAIIYVYIYIYINIYIYIYIYIYVYIYIYI